MSNELKFPDLSELINGMSKEEAAEYIASHLNATTRDEFLQRKRTGDNEQLRKEYEQRAAQIKGMNPYTNAKHLSALKAEMRAKGLEVW